MGYIQSMYERPNSKHINLQIKHFSSLNKFHLYYLNNFIIFIENKKTSIQQLRNKNLLLVKIHYIFLHHQTSKL